MNNLKGNTPDEAVEEKVIMRRNIQHEKMKDKSGETMEIDEEDFTNVIRRFVEKKSATYEFITKAGPKFKSAILKLCRRFISKETFPTRFNLTTLIQLPKKGQHSCWITKDSSI